MKFLSLNVDFSSPSPNPLDSKRPAHTGVKQGYPSKNGYLSAVVLSSVKMVADQGRHLGGGAGGVYEPPPKDF